MTSWNKKIMKKRMTLVKGKSRCDACGLLVKYSETYDAFYCGKCNEWLEVKCKDKNCEYCSQRPAKPRGK